MSRFRFIALFILVSSIAVAASQPNVVFIIVDDLNDLPYQPDGKPLVPTPHIDRLKARGVTFTNAHTNDPLCAPSRASMIFGLYPQTTGLYWFEDWRDNGILNKSVSLHDNLRAGGYAVYGTGKIYHGSQNGLFDEYGYPPDVGPWPWDGQSTNYRLPHPQQLYLFEGEDADMDYQWEHTFGSLADTPVWPPDPARGVPGYTGWRLYGKPFTYNSPEDRDSMADELGAHWSTEIINRRHDKPFALFTGLIRTHTPLYAPDNYFKRFPLESIQLPEVDPHDLDDLSPALGNEKLYGFRRYKMLVRHEGKDLFRKWLQAYMACVSFIDDQVGTILDAIEASPQADNTLIFFTSDHGFHMGEKNFLYKGSLWEPSTRIPLIIAGVPGAKAGTECDHPVSLIDIYPTFNELLGLEKHPNQSGNGYELEGHSLVPFLHDPDSQNWRGPDVAITTIPGKNHMWHQIYEGSLFPHFSVRSEGWRYSLSSNGGEELYNHEADPFEWKNLALDSEYAFIKETLRDELIALRDGNRWQSLQKLQAWLMPHGTGEVTQHSGAIRFSGVSAFELATQEAFDNFEFEADVLIDAGETFRIGYRGASIDGVSTPQLESEAARHSHFQAGEWNHYRMRIHGVRHQVWINNRYVSDDQEASVSANGPLRILFPGGNAQIEMRNARIRSL